MSHRVLSAIRNTFDAIFFAALGAGLFHSHVVAKLDNATNTRLANVTFAILIVAFIFSALTRLVIEKKQKR